jgi:hypothetical protein
MCDSLGAITEKSLETTLMDEQYRKMSNTWLSTIVVDPLLFYMALTKSVGHLGYQVGRLPCAQVLACQLETTRQLKEIVESSTHWMSEPTILAVLFLLTRAVSGPP